jgi:hypothetical protein
MSYTTILISTTTTGDAPEASRPYSIALSSDLVRAPMVLKSLRIALVRQGTSRLRMAGSQVHYVQRVHGGCVQSHTPGACDNC